MFNYIRIDVKYFAMRVMLSELIVTRLPHVCGHYVLVEESRKKKLRGFGPLANHADRATAASWRSSANFCG
jgi:hypothetical protein